MITSSCSQYKQKLTLPMPCSPWMQLLFDVLSITTQHLAVKSMESGQALFSAFLTYVLRPIFFAYETRAQIVRLILETLERLVILVNEDNKKTTAKQLWEKINIIMTDSVEKNLHIEDEIASALGSTHVPLHLLCKAHTVEIIGQIKNRRPWTS